MQFFKSLPEIMAKMMTRLAAIPGLTFLGTYVMSVQGLRSRIDDDIGDNLGLIDTTRGAVTGAMDDLGVKRRRRPDTGGMHTIGGNDSYDEAADYSSVNMVEDDYPSSDDYVSYHDDDYRT